ncbi:MAG: carbohydrate kinase family protein [Propylenella sp.]
MPTVLVIGDVMSDIVVKPAGPIAVGADTRATIRELPGGSGANQAAWLASEGVSVRFAARVGRADHAAQMTLFAAMGVDARLGSDEALPTGTLVTLVAADGERSFLTDRGANETLSRADLPKTLLDGVDLVSVSGYALFAPEPRAAVLALLDAARQRSIPFAVDPASYSWLEEAGAQNFVEWTAGARFCFPNEEEAAVLSGSGDLEAQLQALARRYEVVAIKRGAAGAAAIDAKSGVRASAPALPATVVDTSGAGDAFLAGFLAAYLRGEGLEAALRRGVELGSRAVTHLGGRPAVRMPH